MQNPFVCGRPVVGDEFFGRAKETERFFEYLDPVQPFEVLGLHRSGKTSFLRHVAGSQQAAEVGRRLLGSVFQRTSIVYVDLQHGFDSKSEFFFRLSEEIARSLGRGCRAIRPRSFVDFAAFDGWFHRLMTDQTDLRLVVILDEVARLTDSEASFDNEFFTRLRALVTAFPDRFAWVTASYPPLAELAKHSRRDSPFFNYFNREIVIGGLGKDESQQFLRQLANRSELTLTDEEISEITDIGGRLPFFLQAAASHWVDCRAEAEDRNQLRPAVLARTGKTVAHLGEGFVKRLSAGQAGHLRAILQNESPSEAALETKAVLLRLGLLESNNGEPQIAGQAVRKMLEKAVMDRRRRTEGEHRDLVFISYSHKDERALNELLTHLRPYDRDDSICRWSDKQITKGAKWEDEIRRALSRTRVAVLLVTPDFLASDFIDKGELGPLLKEAESGGVRILWVHVRPSAYQRSPLGRFQAVLDPEPSLAEMQPKARRDRAWVQVCREIEQALR